MIAARSQSSSSSSCAKWNPPKLDDVGEVDLHPNHVQSAETKATKTTSATKPKTPADTGCSVPRKPSATAASSARTSSVQPA